MNKFNRSSELKNLSFLSLVIPKGDEQGEGKVCFLHPARVGFKEFADEH